jgi:tRNA threonylcarbamoyladenosine biosynthesis protein TsaB
MGEPWLILETSGRGGWVGLAQSSQVVGSLRLDPSRRHNRDLAPAVRELLANAELRPKEIQGVMVSQGPGSFTGLRVGIMSAKMFAYATGCRLVAVPTLHAIAEQAPAHASEVAVIADALQGMVYVQRFRRVANSEWEAVEELRIDDLQSWIVTLPETCWISGPGVDIHRASIPETILQVSAESCTPTLEALARLGSRLPALSESEVLTLEPIYLRGSSAEEKAARLEASRQG